MSNTNYTGQKNFFAARYLYELLCENDHNIGDPHFTSIWNVMKSFHNDDFITIVQHLDFFLHPELEDIIEKYSIENITVVSKDDFPSFEVDDFIDNQKVLAKCSFTMWLFYEEN